MGSVSRVRYDKNKSFIFFCWLASYLFAACARITCIEVNFCRGCDWSGWSGVRWDGTDGLQSPKPTDCQSPGAETQSTALALGQ